MQHNTCAIDNFNVVLHYFLGKFRVSVLVTMESLQEEPPCDVNVISTKELSSLAPSSVTTDRSCLAPIINTMEEVDNFRESENVEKDEGNISEPKSQMIPPPRVINKGQLIPELLPIHAQEDPYMIQLFGRKRYIDIVSNALIGWVARVCSSFKFRSSLFFYDYVCVGLLLFVILCMHMYFLLFFFYPKKTEPLTSNDQI